MKRKLLVFLVASLCFSACTCSILENDTVIVLTKDVVVQGSLHETHSKNEMYLQASSATFDPEQRYRFVDFSVELQSDNAVFDPATGLITIPFDGLFGVSIGGEFSSECQRVLIVAQTYSPETNFDYITEFGDLSPLTATQMRWSIPVIWLLKQGSTLYFRQHSIGYVCDYSQFVVTVWSIKDVHHHRRSAFDDIIQSVYSSFWTKSYIAPLPAEAGVSGLRFENYVDETPTAALQQQSANTPFDPINGNFFVPTTGLYTISVHGSWPPLTACRIDLMRVYPNTTTTAIPIYYYEGFSVDSNDGVVFSLLLTKGEYLYLQGYYQLVGDDCLVCRFSPELTITLIAESMAADERDAGGFSGFLHRNATSDSGGNTVFTRFAGSADGLVALYDRSNMASAGVLTFPFSGVVAVNLATHTPAGERAVVEAVHTKGTGTADVLRWLDYPAFFSSVQTAHATMLLRVAASDTLAFRVPAAVAFLPEELWVSLTYV